MSKRRNEKITGMRLVETITSASGLYTLSEASRFAGVHPATLQYWNYGTTGRKPLRDAEIARDEGKFLTFYEFVEALAIKSLRVDKHASLQKIRAAIQEASEKYGIKYPFAQQNHRTVLIGGDFHIFLEIDAPTGLTGKDRAQKSFRPCLEPFMEALRFDEKKMACEYIAYRFGAGDKVIKMNPKFCFGEPMVSNTGYTAETLYKAAVAEGDYDRAAKFYDVEREYIVAACSYWEGLTTFASRN
jgi:uncharacterized protein (DUF433 family)